MSRPFRFALQLRSLDDPDAVAAAARQAQQLGYRDLYSYDHIGEVDPFVPLMVAASAAESVRVGPLVINNEFHHPAMLARTAATVDRMTGGRLVLGMGTGYMQSEHDAIGMLLREPGERVSRFEESLEVLRALLDDGAMSFDGQYHSIDVDDLGVRPVQAHVPLLIGGHGRRVVGIAGRHADIFQFTGLTHGPGGVPSGGGFRLADVQQRQQWLTQAAGDRDGSIERSILVQATDVAPDADVRADALAMRFGLERDQLDDTPFALIGSVERVVDKLQRLRDLIGVNHVVVRDAVGFAPVVAALGDR